MERRGIVLINKYNSLNKWVILMLRIFNYWAREVPYWAGLRSRDMD